MCHRYLNPLFQDLCPLIMLPTLARVARPPCQDLHYTMVNENSVDDYPSPPGVNLMDTSYYIPMSPYSSVFRSFVKFSIKPEILPNVSQRLPRGCSSKSTPYT